MNVVVLYTFLLFGLFKAVICGQECNARNYSGIVCVCNSTYCDDFPPLGRLKPNQIAVYTSSKCGKRFRRSNVFFKSQLPDLTRTANTISVKVDASKTFQSIHGFGGAFTDAAGINFRRLSQQTRRQLLHAYYAQNGIEYTLGRVPIASCDFSTYEYSYLDKPNDFDLNSFSLAKEDYDLKIPFILSALNLSRGGLKLFASPWSAPGWMKTNERMKGGGRLKGEFNGKYYQTYAKYFVRYTVG
jgi:glucosylceramidase